MFRSGAGVGSPRLLGTWPDVVMHGIIEAAEPQEAAMGTEIATIIDRKGSEVVTIPPDGTLAEAVELLARRRIGALVVSRDERTVEGILSERDIVRHLALDGARTLEASVAEAMTTAVATCTARSTIDEVATLMTEGRFRHVPVLEDGVLIAIISIGDVVKSRMDELSAETEQLQAYVAGNY